MYLAIIASMQAVRMLPALEPSQFRNSVCPKLDFESSVCALISNIAENQ